MKAILLAATVLAAMTVACEAQSDSQKLRRYVNDRDEQIARQRDKANKEAAEARKLLETGGNLFGVDKRWNENDYGGTLVGKQLADFKLGDWGRTTVQFRILNKVSKNEFLAITKSNDARVVLVRGLDTSKVIDDAEFILPYVIVIPGTYEYVTATGSRSTVLVLERNESKVDEIVAKERERRDAEEPKNQIENAKRRLWLEQPDESKIVAGEYPTVNGTWWNGVEGEGKQTITISRGNKSNGFMAHSSYQLPSGERVRWQLNGTISEVGHISGKFKHIKAPKGFANQTHIAALSPDGNTITGRAVFDTTGGHDYVWTRVQKNEPNGKNEPSKNEPDGKEKQSKSPPDVDDAQARSKFVGKWRVLNDKGGTIFVITLDDSGESQTTNVAGLTGKWEVVGNEVRITWSEGWRDIIRPEKNGYRKYAFKPGMKWEDKPIEELRTAKITGKQ